MTKTTLIIGDAHVEAKDNLRRFEALGNFIADVRPDYLVQIGDFLSLDSLSNWDLNKRAKMEGRRFGEELRVGKKAVELMMKPMKELQKQQKQNKKKSYLPEMYSLLGNHEDRWYRYLDTHPEMIDVVDPYHAVGFDKYGWRKIEYREYALIENVYFTHIPMNGLNKPLSGGYLMRHAAQQHNRSVVFGHTHKLAIATDTNHGHDANQIVSVNVGCFFEGVPEYAEGSITSKDWWRGVVLLDHYNDGKFDISTYSLERMLGAYL